MAHHRMSARSINEQPLGKSLRSLRTPIHPVFLLQTEFLRMLLKRLCQASEVASTAGERSL